MGINEKLAKGTYTIAELIENLQRFPQGANARINKNMLMVITRSIGKWEDTGEEFAVNTLYSLDDNLKSDEFAT